jgi:hypothetical protein
MRRELGARAYLHREYNWSYFRQVLREAPCEQRTETSAGEARVSKGEEADAERRADEAWGSHGSLPESMLHRMSLPGTLNGNSVSFLP